LPRLLKQVVWLLEKEIRSEVRAMRKCAIFLLVPLVTASACSKTPAVEPGKTGRLFAVLQTSMGDIKCELFEKDRPITVKNFVDLAMGKKEWMVPGSEIWVKKPLYDGTIFHRVLPDYMIHGGDPLGNGGGGPGFVFKEELEPPIKFEKPGMMSMAVSGFTNKNGSQFFITAKTAPDLDRQHKTKYTIFGECSNNDIVQAISRVDRDNNDRPKANIYLKHVVICRGENPCIEEK
jgi:peptidyl-prolyl cis-trans isomerase A (cyclophilin A)